MRSCNETNLIRIEQFPLIRRKQYTAIYNPIGAAYRAVGQLSTESFIRTHKRHEKHMLPLTINPSLYLQTVNLIVFLVRMRPTSINIAHHSYLREESIREAARICDTEMIRT